MDWIFTYQYELMYSFGALFALFSMMSYVAPAVSATLERGENSMDSSENFFEGFEGLDLSSLIDDKGFDEGDVEEEEALAVVIEAPFSPVEEKTVQEEQQPVLNVEAVKDEAVVEPIESQDKGSNQEVEKVLIEEERVKEVVEEDQELLEAPLDKKVILENSFESEVAIVEESDSDTFVEMKSENFVDEDDDDDEVIDYFSQSDTTQMSIEEDCDEDKHSAASDEMIHSITEPVVDGFRKKPSIEVSTESLRVPHKETVQKEVLKVSREEIKEDLLILRKQEKLSLRNEGALVLNKKNRETFDD